MLKDKVYRGNNQAEYGRLNLGLRKAFEPGIANLSVFLDSQLVIYQMNEKYGYTKRLVPLWLEANRLAKPLDAVKYNWIAQQHNFKADALEDV